MSLSSSSYHHHRHQHQNHLILVFTTSVVTILVSKSINWFVTTYSNKNTTQQVKVKQQQEEEEEEQKSLSKLQSQQYQYQIPDGIKNCPYVGQVELAIKLALQCGQNMYQYCDVVGTNTDHDSDDNNTNTNNKNGPRTLILQTKGQAEDFCTQIDIENEHIIMKAIQQQYPKDDIIGEETVGTGPLPLLKKDIPTWIIDPIDGTTNFANGLPLCCVSIGYCVNGIPTVGVVYAPMTNELYVGVKQYGAYRNNIRLHDRRKNTNNQKNDEKKQLVNAVINFEFGYTRNEVGIQKLTNTLQKIMIQGGCRAIRSLGSGVLDLLYVATGKLDIVYAGIAGEGWKPWDYCAGTVIVQETGAIIQSFETDPDDTTAIENFDLYSTSVICGINKELVKEIRTLIL